jgi:plastocyanin
VAAAWLAACGGTTTPAGTTLRPGYYIGISSMAYSPLNLAAPAGSTVTVINRDAMNHSVTSQAAPGSFTPGAAAGAPFDTGLFTGSRTFRIPAGLADGTVLHYYCSSHGSLMATPNGTITIDSTAGVGPAPAGGGGVGGGY